MLIKCPECGKEVSDKADNCINCGYPIKSIDIFTERNNSYTCIVDGVPRDFTEHIENLYNGDFRPLAKPVDEYGMKLADAATIWNIIRCTKQVPKEYNSSQLEEYRARVREIDDEGLPKCPYCSSTNLKKISGMSKAGSVAMFGVFAMGKVSKQWHCNSCKSDF